MHSAKRKIVATQVKNLSTFFFTPNPALEGPFLDQYEIKVFGSFSTFQSIYSNGFRSLSNTTGISYLFHQFIIYICHSMNWNNEHTHYLSVHVSNRDKTQLWLLLLSSIFTSRRVQTINKTIHLSDRKFNDKNSNWYRKVQNESVHAILISTEFRNPQTKTKTKTNIISNVINSICIRHHDFILMIAFFFLCSKFILHSDFVFVKR